MGCNAGQVHAIIIITSLIIISSIISIIFTWEVPVCCFNLPNSTQLGSTLFHLKPCKPNLFISIVGVNYLEGWCMSPGSWSRTPACRWSSWCPSHTLWTPPHFHPSRLEAVWGRCGLCSWWVKTTGQFCNIEMEIWNCLVPIEFQLPWFCFYSQREAAADSVALVTGKTPTTCAPYTLPLATCVPRVPWDVSDLFGALFGC